MCPNCGRAVVDVDAPLVGQRLHDEQATAVLGVQLQRLAEASRLPHVALQVLPFATGAHQGLDGAFKILDVGGDCVEVAAGRRTDSKNPGGPALRFTPTEWTTFLAAVKRGLLSSARA